MDCNGIKEEYKELLHFQLGFINELDLTIQFTRAKLKGYEEIGVLCERIDDMKKATEDQLTANKPLSKKLGTARQKNEKVVEEISDLRCQEQEIIKRKETRVEHIKHLWKCITSAMDFYKSRLHCHIEVQVGLIILSYKNISTDSKRKYFVKLVNKDDKWSCVEMLPKLKSSDTLMETLKETNDLQGFLSNVRNRFKIANIKTSVP